jgi:cytidyltransferase-like protein
MSNRKKVLVSGCFDLLHSGHIAFLSESAEYGDLYVCIGSDETVKELKGRYTINSQAERKYILDAIKYVHECRVSRGGGILDFLPELEEINPDILVVNEDGDTLSKRELCKVKNIEYKVLKRTPYTNLPKRSTTKLRGETTIPFRIDLAGGWLDQPYVSKHYPGSVLTISIEPTIEFNSRSGMASSTRKKAIELWKHALPGGDPYRLGTMLFACDNPPGTEVISGSQDALGITLPGLNKLNYNGKYLPESYETCHDEEILSWLENRLHLVTLSPREWDYDVLANTSINAQNAKVLAEASEACWDGILSQNSKKFGKAFRAAFEAQIAMFPNMVDNQIFEIINQYKDKALGWKLSGAGGGGYLILVAEKNIEGALKIKIRRRDNS